MPPSPAMRCSPGRELKSENHKRGRSLEGGILFREKDDDLALFNEVQSRERDNFLLQSNDDFEDLFSNKLRYFSDHKLGISIPARGKSSDLLNAEGDKNDYDWLLTPPETPLFPSLDDEAIPVNRPQRGRPRSQPISISRPSTMERSNRSSRGSPSPNRLSPSPRSSHSTYQSRGRQSPGPHSSPPPGLRSSTPTRRPSPPPTSTPAPRSSTPTPRRMSTGSSGPAAPARVRGNSSVRTSRGNSASPKIKAWQANIPGFSSEVPPNLRTSLADRPASYVRGSSPASRNGSKSGRQSMSPTASRSVCSSYSHDRDRFSSHSKGSIASFGDDDVDSPQSIPFSISDHSAPRSISTFSNSRGLSSSKKPTKIVTSSSAPKRSFDVAIRQLDHRKGPPQNMFRPLLSSVPSSTFYAGKSSAAHRSIISRNSSLTTSSNASSDLGTSGAHDTEGSEHNQEDTTSDCTKAPYHDMQEEVFAFDKADSIDEKSVDKNHEKLLDGHDEYDGRLKLESHVVGDEISTHQDNGMEISIASEVLDKGDVRGADRLDDTLLCSRCGRRFHATEEIDWELKLCTNCRSAEILSVLTTSPQPMNTGENSPGVSANMSNHGSADTFAPSAATHASLAVTTMGQSMTDGYKEPNRNLLPESIGAQGEHILVSRQVGSPPPLSRNTTLNGDEIVDQQLQNNGGYSNSKADVSDGAGISLLLTPISGKGPILRSRTFTATSITCDDFSYMRDSATSTRSSFGHGTASASSSLDLGSSRQTEARAQRQLSSRKSDTENYRYEMYTKHQRSTSSLSGTSTHGFHASSLATSSHEETLEVSAIQVEKGNLDVTRVALQDISLASESLELDNVSTDIESDSNWRTVSELSSHTTNIQLGSTSVASVSNHNEPALHDYVEDLANDSRSGVDVEASSTHQETCWEEDAMSNASTDRVDVAEAPILNSLDVISELESENDHVVSPDSVFDIDSQNSKSSIDDLQDPSHPVASSHGIAASVEEFINQDHVHNILEESTVMLEGQGRNHMRSLTLEEATDSILFCSSIVHNLAYEAANIAIEKENSIQLEGSRPVVTLVGKSNPDRRDSRARTMSKRNTKSQKTRQRRLETDSKPPPSNTAPDEKSDVSTTRIVGAPNKGDSMKPPKLESKCNCAIM